MKITVFLPLLDPNNNPVPQTFTGIRNVRFINGLLTFDVYDKHLSDFRTTRFTSDKFLYFIVDHN